MVESVSCAVWIRRRQVPPLDARLEVYTRTNEGLQIKKRKPGELPPVPGRLLQEARRAVDGLESPDNHLRRSRWTSTKSRKYWRMILRCWSPKVGGRWTIRAGVSIPFYQFRGTGEKAGQQYYTAGWLQQDKKREGATKLILRR